MTLYEWNEMIQKAIDWIEGPIEAEPSLSQLAEKKDIPSGTYR